MKPEDVILAVAIASVPLTFLAAVVGYAPAMGVEAFRAVPFLTGALGTFSWGWIAGFSGRRS